MAGQAAVSTVPATRVRARTRLRPYQRVNLWAARIFLWSFTALTLFPVLWVVAVSFRVGDAFFADNIWPEKLTWDNYYQILFQSDFLLWFRNTVKVGAAVSLIQFFMTATGAYAFSRLRFFGRRYGLVTLVLLQMFPATMAMASNYILLAKLKLINTHTGYILVSSGAAAFMIWMLKGYIDSIPRELDEAALVDGATRWQVFMKIILPLSRPFIAVQILFTMLGTFGEFMNASLFLRNPKLWPMAVGMFRFVGGNFQAQKWPVFAAGAVLVSLPLVVLWMLLQRHLISGLTRGAVKG